MNALSAMSILSGPKSSGGTGKVSGASEPLGAPTLSGAPAGHLKEGFQGAIARIASGNGFSSELRGEAAAMSLPLETQDLEAFDLQSLMDSAPGFSSKLSDRLLKIQDGQGTVAGDDLLKAIADLVIEAKTIAPEESSLLAPSVDRLRGEIKPVSGEPSLINAEGLSIESIHAALDRGQISMEQFDFLAKKLSDQGVASPKLVLENLMKNLGYQTATVIDRPALVRHSTSEVSLTVSSRDVAAQSSSLQHVLSQIANSANSKTVSSDFTTISRALQGQSEMKYESSVSGLLRQDGSGFVMKSGSSEWAPVVVDRNASNWSRELVAALGDRLKMQVSQQVKEATVRLDPPELGRVDFSVRMDGDRVSVQINSGNAQVRDLLMQQVERLRSELSGSASGGVDVQVGDGKRDQSRGQTTFASGESTVDANRREDGDISATATKPVNNHSWLSTSA